MKKALLFCALTVCALCGGYTPVLAEGEVETPSVVTEGDSILRSTVIVTRREELTQEEIDSLSCPEVLQKDNATYHPTNGVIPHIFSVGTQTRDDFGITKRYVCFSKGNLQYQPESVEGAACWRFAEHQYDCIENMPPSAVDKYSSSANYWYDLFVYFGETWPNPIYNGGSKPNAWRCLSCPEWEYLFNTRTASDKTTKLWFKGSIVVNETKTVNGTFLLPDDFPIDFTIGENNEISIADWCDKTDENVFANHTISLADFEKLEEQGAVFLPVCDYKRPDGRRPRADEGGFYLTNSYFYGQIIAFVMTSLANERWQDETMDNSKTTTHLAVRLVQTVTY